MRRWTVGRNRRVTARLLAFALAVLCACGGPGGRGQQQTSQFKAGFNLLSPQQDVEIGRQNAAQVERQMPLLGDAEAQAYITQVGQRLAAKTPGEKFPYQFKVVDVREVNAFALPGGFMYVNRGAIEAAQNEAELAGVMAHEISHVALRHGTSQMSKQLVAEKGLALAAAILGSGDGRSAADQVLGAAGGTGLSLLFLKFGRTAEKQADITGAEIMAAAGYDPRALPNFFKTLQQEGQRVPQILSDHPDPGNRISYLNELIPSLKVSANPTVDTPEFQHLRARLRGMPAAEKRLDRSAAGVVGTPRPPTAKPPAPADEQTGLREQHGLYSLAIPNNWQQVKTEAQAESIFAPPGAVAQGNQGTVITHGMFVGIFDLPPNERELSRVTNAFLQLQLRDNPEMQVQSSPQPLQLGGLPALLTYIGGDSPITGRAERDIVCTAVLPSGKLFYLVLVAPADEAAAYKNAFERTLSSVQFGQ